MSNAAPNPALRVRRIKTLDDADTGAPSPADRTHSNNFSSSPPIRRPNFAGSHASAKR